MMGILGGISREVLRRIEARKNWCNRMAFAEFLTTELRENFDPLSPARDPLKVVMDTKQFFEGESVQKSRGKWENVPKSKGPAGKEEGKVTMNDIPQSCLNRIMSFVGDVTFLARSARVNF